MNVTLATPPILSTPTGSARSSIRTMARWNIGTTGAPCPPAAMSAARKSYDHRNAEPLGKRRPLPKLDGQAAVRPVQHRLAVEPHDRDLARRHAVRGQERLDRLGVHVGDEFLGVGEQFRPLGAVG